MTMTDLGPGLTRNVLPSDYPALETLIKNVVKEKQKFERLVMTKAELLEMFAVRLFCSRLTSFHALILSYRCKWAIV